MTYTTKDPSTVKYWYWKELLITTLVSWVPLTLGRNLRRLMYRGILGRIGKSVRIEPQVEFMGARGIEIGNGVKINRSVCLRNNGKNSRICLRDYVKLNNGVFIKTYSGGDITIGNHTYIGPYTCIAGKNITIGKYCQLSSHLGIYAANHNFADPKRKIREQGDSYKGIVIEDDCWLGSGVKILDGVNIGQGSVIGAGAVVTKNIPPYSVAVGVPARVIKSRRSSELMNFTQKKEYICKDGSRLPMTLSTALTKVEETIELIHAKVEEPPELSHQHLARKDIVSAQLDLQNLLYHLLDCIRQAMAVDTVTLLLQTEEEQQLAVSITIGLEEEITTGIKIPIGRGFAGRIAASRELMIVNDLSTVEVVSPILRNKGLQSMLGVPLLVKDQVIGVFHIGTFLPRQFTKEDAQLLQLVADHVGLAIDCLKISRLLIKNFALFREKLALTRSLQKISQTIRNFHFHPLTTGCLKGCVATTY